MARRARRNTTARVHAEHLEWLKLVEVSGPFLSPPVLAEALPQGLIAEDRDLRAELSAAHEEWRESRHDRAIHHAWIEHVLWRGLEFEEEDLTRDVPGRLDVREPVHGETLRADLVVLDSVGEDGVRPARLLVSRWPAETDLERPTPNSRWKASPLDRMVELLRNSADSELSVGFVTNGEQWTLVSVPTDGTSLFVTWYADLWFQEPITLRALRTFLGAERFFGDPDETLERLIARSADQQHQVTDQLGIQVREAIELLVQAIDRADRSRAGALLASVDEKTFYEAAVTVMMRLVFVFYAEEQGLLPIADSGLYRTCYALGPLSAELRTLADQQGEDVLERRRSAWPRMLAAFRAIHGGVHHQDLQLIAHGGSLFDPDRFPFLEGRLPGSAWREAESDPLPIDDRMALRLLEALQVLRVNLPGGRTEARRLSFRELGVEQIGHVYEGLLDHTVMRAVGPVLSLKGKAGQEPEVELARLVECYDPIDHSELVFFVAGKSGRTPNAIEKDLPPEYEITDEGPWLVACDGDASLWESVRPFAGLVREDRTQHPVVIREGSAYVTAGTDRRSTGTHYTPKSLTEPIVRNTLEPLVYGGSTDEPPEQEWKLRPPAEILALKVCDLACGSGAFLVQACRYLADRLIEAWEETEEAHPGRILVSPEGVLAAGSSGEKAIPGDNAERRILARRLVAERCLYGVDRNSLAVEMAKLSLWLVTMQRDRPFGFLDHAVKCGDSLLGIIDTWQLRYLRITRGSCGHAALGMDRVGAAIATALRLRSELESFATEHHEHAQLKDRLSRKAEKATEDLRLVSDALFSIAISFAAKTERAGKFEGFVDQGLSFQAAELLQQGEGQGGASEARAMLEKELDRYIAEFTTEERGRPLFFHWALEYPEVFSDEGRCPGFDAIIGNPPWIAHSGRAAQPLPAAIRAFYDKYYASFKKYKTTHGLFCERAVRLLTRHGRLGLLLPTSVADLGGYSPVREEVSAYCEVDAALPNHESFPGVYQPCFHLHATRVVEGRQSGDEFELASDLLSPDTLRLLQRFSGMPSLPPKLFSDTGVRTDGALRNKLVTLDSMTQLGSVVPLLEGKDIKPFFVAAPRIGLMRGDLEAAGYDANRVASASIVIRQTARFPIAAPNRGYCFRGSLLGCSLVDGYTVGELCAWLNSAIVRWHHYYRYRDARQGTPQVKVSHLRSIPAPPPQVRKALRTYLRLNDMDRLASGQAELDECVGAALGLSPEERLTLAVFREEHERDACG